jgi:hypothetical protein
MLDASSVPGDTPLSYEWLKANGWKTLTRQERQPTDHVRRPVAWEVAGGKRPFVSPDDLCVELALATAGDDGEWHCWVSQVEPHRFVHVRMMRTVGDVIRLWEGLTGRDWSDRGEKP